MEFLIWIYILFGRKNFTIQILHLEIDRCINYTLHYRRIKKTGKNFLPEVDESKWIFIIVLTYAWKN